MQRRRDRQRNDAAETPGDGEGQDRAECGADERCEQRHQQGLAAIDREDVAAGGAERLHGADHVALARQMARDRIGDADAADQKRGQADQRQELGEAVDAAFELWRGLAAGADLPAGVGKILLRLVLQCRHRAVAGIGLRQAQPVLPAHETAGLQQAGGAQRRLAHQDARAKSDRTADLVRLALQRRAQFDGDIADGDAVAGFQIEPRQQRRIDRRAISAAALRKKIGKRHGWIGHHRVDQRIIAVDGFGLDQVGSAITRAGHSPQRRHRRHGAMGIEEALLGRARLALNE